MEHSGDGQERRDQPQPGSGEVAENRIQEIGDLRRFRTQRRRSELTG